MFKKNRPEEKELIFVGYLTADELKEVKQMINRINKKRSRNEKPRLLYVFKYQNISHIPKLSMASMES